MKRFGRSVLSIGLVVAGIFSAAFGLKGFLLSSHFIDGGVTGISMLLSNILKVPLSIFILVINLPFIAIGYRPNTEVFKEQLEVDEKGYLVVHDETGSKIEGVFIAGDVHDHRYRQAVTAAADGCKAAIDAERWLESEGITEAATTTAW